MNIHHRDGLLAVGSLVGLVAAGLLTVGTGVFVRPVAVGVGVVGALAIELLFVRYPAWCMTVWKRPAIALAGVVTLAWVALWAILSVPWVLGALAWGLVTYLVLLGCILAGLGNPVAVLVSPARDRD